MNTREKMIEFRKKHLLTINDMSKRCEVSNDIIEIVEKGGVTHPLLVAKIAEGYGLTDLEAEELMPKCRRQRDRDYDQNMYVIDSQRRIPVKRKIDVYDEYVRETRNRKEEY